MSTQQLDPILAAASSVNISWQNVLSYHDAELAPLRLLVIGQMPTGPASLPQNAIDDATGKRLGPVPKDCAIGDQAMGTVIGT